MEWQEYIQLHGEPTGNCDNTKETGNTQMSSQSRPFLYLNPNIQIKIADFGNSCWEVIYQ